MNRSISTLRQFHLILQMDWLNDNATHSVTKEVLGWSIPPKKVLPHESQARRKGKTATAVEALGQEDYSFLLEDNAFDLLMYHVSRRISLERMCYAGIIG